MKRKNNRTESISLYYSKYLHNKAAIIVHLFPSTAFCGEKKKKKQQSTLQFIRFSYQSPQTMGVHITKFLKYIYSVFYYCSIESHLIIS